MRRRRERGTILLYVAVCLVALALLFGAMVPLATSFKSRTTRRIDETKARLAFEAGLALVRSKSLSLTLVVGTPIAISLNGVTGMVTAANNDAQQTNSLLITGTMTRNGRSYRYSRVIGERQPTPFSFALFAKNSVILKKTTFGANGADGDVWSNGSIDVGSTTNFVNGNLMASSGINGSNVTITGRRLQNLTPIAWPTLSDVAYRNESTSLGNLLGGGYYLLSSTVNGIAFGKPLLSDAYPIRFYEGNLDLKGTISGRGTIYVKGDLKISGNLRYASPDDEMAIIVKGNARVMAGARIVEGYIFCDGGFTVDGETDFTRSAVVASVFNMDKDMWFMRDNAVRDDTDEGVRLRLPYYWP